MYEMSINNNEKFPEEDRVLVMMRKNVQENIEEDFKYPKKYSYEFISFVPVAVTSEMIGTSIEELVMHNYPNKRSWECSRLCKFPQELVLRFNYRSHLKYVLLRAKPNRPINKAIIFIADGVGGNFNDLEYRKIGSADYISEECINIKVDGIGNYVKIVMLDQPIKTQENPFGQVSISQCKFFGRKIDHLLFYPENEEANKDPIDSILINMGIPLDNDLFFLTDENYEISPVDSETKVTLKDMLKILRKAESVKDYEILKKIKKDMKIIYYLGNEILNKERDLKIFEASEKYDKAIIIREKTLEDLKNKRDGYDAIYETSRYEKMIVFRRPTTAELLDAEERKLREESEMLERLRREKLEKERRDKEEEERRRRLEEESKKNRFNRNDEKKKFVEYVPQSKPIKETFNDLKYNQGDKDLEPYFAPLVMNIKGKVPEIDINLLRRAQHQKVLQVTGIRLYSSLVGEDWKMREAAVKAFLEFLQNPILPKYQNNTFPLFNAAIEVVKKASEDKVIQIYLEGLSILATCLAPPVCGNELDPILIQKSVNFFIPIIIKKISELNFRARDVSLATLIQIFKHPALHIGDLVKGCMDIVEQQEGGVSPDKQPWNVLLARLEIILHILDEYGIDEKLWDWYPVFTELVLPSLFHPNPDCRLNAVENIVILYKSVGDDIKIIINDLQNLKPNLKETIVARMDEIDKVIKKDINSQDLKQSGIKTSKTNGKYEGRAKSHKDNSNEEAKLIESLKKTPKNSKSDLKGSTDKSIKNKSINLSVDKNDKLLNSNKSNGMEKVKGKQKEDLKGEKSLSPSRNNLRKSKNATNK